MILDKNRHTKVQKYYQIKCKVLSLRAVKVFLLNLYTSVHELTHELEKQKKNNKKFSSVRAKVEHPFQIIKCQWNYRKTRYRGLKKNTGQLNILLA